MEEGDIGKDRKSKYEGDTLGCVTELQEEEAWDTPTDEELSQVTEVSWDRVWRNWWEYKKLMLAQSQFIDLLYLFLTWLVSAQTGVYGGEFARVEANT